MTRWWPDTVTLRVRDLATLAVGLLIVSPLLLPANAATSEGTDGDGRMFVVCQDGSEIVAFDPAAPGRLQRANLPAGPANILYSPSMKRVVAAHPEAGQLTLVDPATLAVDRTIDIGGRPFGLAEDARGRLFVGDWSANVVRVLALPAFETVVTIPVGQAPAHLVNLPIANRVVVANEESGTVSFIDPDRLEVVLELPSGKGPFGLARARNDDLIAVTNVRDGTITLIQPDPPSLYEKVRTGRLPYGAAFTPGTREVLVVNQQGGDVRIITTRPIHDEGKIAVGRYPEGIALDASGNTAFVSSWMSGELSVIDVASRSETQRFEVCDGPRAVISVPEPIEQRPSGRGAQ